MEYTPRYRQPFTLAEAVGLDVSIIAEEIARLQNSLKHLKDTQTTLRECITSDAPADPELTQAVEENDEVIGSQEERISILKMALQEKGVLAGSHYELPSNTGATTPSSAPQPTSHVSPPAAEDDDGGIHL